MQDLNISLLRERFVIHDPQNMSDDHKKAVIALSNRIVLDLLDPQTGNIEQFVIRAHNMHLCVRFAAKIILTHTTSGPIMKRPKSFDWDATWQSLVNDYEYAFNPEKWVSIYHEGRILFKAGDHHPLLDLIEKCDADNDGAYEDSIPVAEDAFKKTGKVIKIEYDGNVALVVNLKKTHGRCGIIHRGADKTTTFNISATAPEGKTLNYAQALNSAAAFLEGMQLSFFVGMSNIKIQMHLIERHSREEKQNREAKRRLSRLTAEIGNYESAFDVRYRPEKPEFQHTVLEAEQVALKTLTPPGQE